MKGGENTYRVLRNKTMHPDLNQMYPSIISFDGINISNALETVKFDLTTQGFHAMIYNPNHSTIFIDPINLEGTNKVMMYFKKDFITTKQMSCDTEKESSKFEKLIKGDGANVVTKQYGSCELRTYRLALSATGEYTTFHGGTSAAASAQVTTRNRVNGVYEREMAITMVIVPNNNLNIYTNAGSDPFTNGTPGATYSFDLSTSPTFSSFVVQAPNLTLESYTGPVLTNNTQYYWRVNAANTVTSTLNVTQSGTITSISVPNVSGTHSWVGDITINLISPNSTSVTLFSGVCSSNDDFDLGFDDASSLTTLPCPPTTGFVFQPSGTLNNLIGENVNGIWTLEVIDGSNQDGGSLDAWSLQFCYSSACGAPVVPTIAGNYSQTELLNDGTSTEFSTSSCDLIGNVTDFAGGNVLGTTTMQSDLLNTIPAPNASGYIRGRRTYTIAANIDGQAQMKLYFTQTDFDDYNSNNTGFLDLPTSGNNGDPNKQNFRLFTNPGSGFAIYGPSGDSLNWNGTVWEYTYTRTRINSTYTFTTMPSCTAVSVSNLQATNVSETSVLMIWNSVMTTPASGWYTFQYRIVGASNWTNGGTANNSATSKLFVGLTPGTNYEFQIRRNCSSQSEGPWSASTLFSTLASGCGSPMVLNSPATATASSITFSWTSVSGAGWYQFRYKETSSSTWISAGTLIPSYTSKNHYGIVFRYKL